LNDQKFDEISSELKKKCNPSSFITLVYNNTLQSFKIGYSRTFLSAYCVSVEYALRELVGWAQFQGFFWKVV